jgi:hypothetical protein
LCSLNGKNTENVTFVLDILFFGYDKNMTDNYRSEEEKNSGLIFSLDLLISFGWHIDVFQSLDLQCRLINTLSNIIKQSDKDILHSLQSCGVVHTICKFILATTKIILKIPSKRLEVQFSKIYRTVIKSMHYCWCVLLSTGNLLFINEIINTNILNSIINEFIPSKIFISISNADDFFYNPFLIRFSAFKLLESVYLFPQAAKILIPNIVQIIAVSNLFENEIKILISNSNHSKNNEILKAIASEIASFIVLIGSESLQNKILVCFILH